MYYLLDDEILNWNYKFKSNKDYWISSLYDHSPTKPSIMFKRNGEEIYEPIDEYTLSLSVAEKRKNEFFKIIETILNTFRYNFNKVCNKSYNDLISDVKYDIEEREYKIGEQVYISLKFNFKCGVGSIIACVKAIEETVEYFNLLYAYDENGKEYNLMKFGIGSVVSLKTEPKNDYVVLNYSYEKSNKKHIIKYVVSKIIKKENGIVYDTLSYYNENDLIWNRNDRLDYLLNLN